MSANMCIHVAEPALSETILDGELTRLRYNTSIWVQPTWQRPRIEPRPGGSGEQTSPNVKGEEILVPASVSTSLDFIASVQ
jgi:hypothetical protein